MPRNGVEAPSGRGVPGRRGFGQTWRDLRAEDRVLGLVRIAVVAGALVWVSFGAVGAGVRLRSLPLLLVFVAYGALILCLVSRWPARSRAVYLGALVADLAVLYFLLAGTGGISSPFLPAVFLLAALTALHCGPVAGTLAAVVAMGCAALSNLDTLSHHHWSDFLLMLIFAGATAFYVGWLTKREASERRMIEALHEDLRARAAELEAAYARCREVQDHLVHSERLATIGRMSAEMAHQVRNPLSSISLNLELLEDEIARQANGSSREARELLSAIHKEVDNLAEVTESYLRFAKLPPFRWEVSDVNALVRDILVFARPEIERRSAVVTERLAEGLPPVRMDRRQLKFAVLGIVSNALEAVDPGGRLRVKTRMNGGGAEVIVSDTGVGIPREHLDRIFEPFFTTKPGGTGLGLPLARRIIEAHGGRLACESGEGGGSTFRSRVPGAGARGGGEAA